MSSSLQAHLRPHIGRLTGGSKNAVLKSARKTCCQVGVYFLSSFILCLGSDLILRKNYPHLRWDDTEDETQLSFSSGRSVTLGI